MIQKSTYHRLINRSIEIVPGFLAWTALIVPLIFTFIAPAVVIIFMIFFDIYWFFKTLIMAWHLLIGYQEFQRALKTDWHKQYSRLTRRNSLYHAVIFAIYNEPIEIITASIQSVKNSRFPKDKLIVVVATESRAGEHARILQGRLTRKFSSDFYQFMVTEHPDITGEIKAKGGNVTWAAKQLTKWIKKQKFNPAYVLVSTADSDSRFHPDYFSALSVKYFQTPQGNRQSYQPIPIFTNNIWYAPAISRILAFGSTFWQLIESTRPWRLVTFSTHAMTLKTLIDINYWDTSIVNEDSRQFWRAYFYYHGRHSVVPIHLPVYMDAVLSSNFWKTMVSQYRQRLRWAYGVEHTPYVVRECFNHSEIPLPHRIVKVFRLLEANYSWATASLYIAFVGWLPIVFNEQFSKTVLGVNFPLFASRLLSFTWIGLIISTIISFKMLPPRPKGIKRVSTFAMVGQWILIPITSIIFGSIPAFDAQTRLMFGRYLGFKVTEKQAVTNKS